MTAAITAVLAMIEQLLPLVLSSAESATIASIIDALTKMLPFIIQEVEALYQPVKNIIAALSANAATTADQLATLQQLDAQVDTAFEAIASQVDPDAPAVCGSSYRVPLALWAFRFAQLELKESAPDGFRHIPKRKNCNG
jgi:hypothetical protein